MTTSTIGDVARMAGITVRTLHHYDAIGLLSPSERRPNGYRAYTGEDVGRLHEILTYRELGLGLDEIEHILAEPKGIVEALVEARKRVDVQIDRLLRIAGGLEQAIEAAKKGTPMTPQERLEAFGDFDPDEHAAEAEERWGDTDAYAESARRTASYSAGDWKRLGEEAEAINTELLALMERDVPADGDETARLVDAHRSHISKWFYECTPEIHAGLGAMYAADERFRRNIDKAGPGLAQYLSDAIAARYGG